MPDKLPTESSVVLTHKGFDVLRSFTRRITDGGGRAGPLESDGRFILDGPLVQKASYASVEEACLGADRILETSSRGNAAADSTAEPFLNASELARAVAQAREPVIAAKRYLIAERYVQGYNDGVGVVEQLTLEGVPAELQRMVILLMGYFDIGGPGDAKYMANVAAFQLGCGDRKEHFDPFEKAEITSFNLEQVALTIRGSYSRSIFVTIPELKDLIYSGISGKGQYEVFAAQLERSFYQAPGAPNPMDIADQGSVNEAQVETYAAPKS